MEQELGITFISNLYECTNVVINHSNRKSVLY